MVTADMCHMRNLEQELYSSTPAPAFMLLSKQNGAVDATPWPLELEH